ncbi:MAG: (Na+)-NQR maturation NqrM [Gammaproteobacteria bacterium]
MLTTVLLSFVVFALAILGLASGLFLSGRRIEGSCGGLNQFAGAGSDCAGACRKPCPARQARMKKAAMARQA